MVVGGEGCAWELQVTAGGWADEGAGGVFDEWRGEAASQILQCWALRPHLQPGLLPLQFEPYTPLSMSIPRTAALGSPPHNPPSLISALL